jgi:hypothetical protein
MAYENITIRMVAESKIPAFKIGRVLKQRQRGRPPLNLKIILDALFIGFESPVPGATSRQISVLGAPFILKTVFKTQMSVREVFCNGELRCNPLPILPHRTVPINSLPPAGLGK